MDLQVISALAQLFAAIGTVSVVILAIWGDKIRAGLAGPQLELQLRDSRGNLTTRSNGRRTIYYHIRLTNRRTWSPAHHVRVLVTDIAKRRAHGSYFPEPVIAPLQLKWGGEFHELFPTVVSSTLCDLGYLDEGSDKFTLSLYEVPNNFRGFVRKEESMQVSVVASAHNYESKSPLHLEISWDGVWSDDMDQMQRHLVVREIH